MSFNNGTTNWVPVVAPATPAEAGVCGVLTPLRTSRLASVISLRLVTSASIAIINIRRRWKMQRDSPLYSTDIDYGNTGTYGEPQTYDKHQSEYSQWS
ncbi:hypothetical protein N7501_001240 [Penicillium viridicatum]|nr:hypothetical protein N7501_001240 [Penicillium viridicatum]